MAGEWPTLYATPAPRLLNLSESGTIEKIGRTLTLSHLPRPSDATRLFVRGKAGGPLREAGRDAGLVLILEGALGALN